MTHYETLGVAPRATPDEIKSAYRRLARRHHPDVNGDPLIFKQANEAYEVLSDPEKRRAYEENLRKKPVELIMEAAKVVVDAYFAKC